MRSWKPGAALLLVALLMSCGGGNKASVGISIFPTVTTVRLAVGTQQFTGTVTGSSNTNVNWAVAPGNSSTSPVSGGNSILGTITTTGLYTAPATLPNPPSVIVVASAAASPNVTAPATVNLDSGIRVQVSPASATLGTGEHFTFTAQVSPTNSSVNWSVNGIAGGNSTVGTISTTGMYTAPAAAGNFTVTATSSQDSSQSGSASVAVLTAAAPTISMLDPNIAAEGSVFQDVYVSGTNFFSTSTVQVNGVSVPTTFISTTFLRARICGAANAALGCASALLASGAPLPLTVVQQNGLTSNSSTLVVQSARPAVIAAFPNSTAQNSASLSVSLNGGFYSSQGPSATTAQFNGQPATASATNPRQLNVGLSGSVLTSAGLFPLELQNAPATGVAGVNLAVEPSAAGIPTAPEPPLAVGMKPTAAAINTATETAVVANQGDNTISLINLGNNPATVIGSAIAVGKAPTGVDVDNILNEAVVVNSADNTVSIVSLASSTVSNTVSLSGFTPTGSTPFSVGVNSLTHRAVVANTSTNTATILDLANSCPQTGTPTPPPLPAPCVVGTVGGMNTPVSTGTTPAISIEPRLNWGVITPGGSGSVSIVDLGLPASPGDIGRTPNLVATFNNTTSTQGIAINTETEQALLTDPNSSNLTLFSVLDQTVTSFALTTGQVASAVNPLTNIGVTVNTSGTATIINLRTQLPVLAAITVGTNPVAVAIDPASNQAVVVNQGSNNVSVLFLGPIRALHLTQSSPATTLTTTSSSLPLTVIGNGFVSGSVVRLDQVALPTTPPVMSGRELMASVPASMLSVPRRYTVDVLNPDGTVSNATDLTVMQAVPVGMSPVAVALDTDRELAVVTNSVDGTVSVVNLATGAVTATIGVGTSPQGVAVLPRLGLAIVTNNGSNNASIVNLDHSMVTSTINTGTGPLGVAIQPDTARAVIANTASNTVTVVGVDTGQVIANVAVDQRPVAVAIDTTDNLAAVAASTQRTVVLINLANGSLAGRFNNVFQLPTGVAFDPVSDMFVVADSVENNLLVVDPLKVLLTGTVRVGINPVSLDYNFQTGTIVTVNNASNTLSVVDFQGQQVRAILPLAASTSSSVAIDPRSNIAVLADQANNRVLLVPLPR